MRIYFFISLFLVGGLMLNAQPRQVVDFNKNWKFFLGDDSAASNYNYDDKKWRTLNLPHDWSIEGDFNDKHPTTNNQAALPAGVGWYRKIFSIPATSKNKKVYICFDGVHRNSEVWINGHYLGKRPYGYISFRYELTPYLHAGAAKNIIAVKVDDAAQPTSRWYTGSGIYRKVVLLTTDKIAIGQWGIFVTTPNVSEQAATINIQSTILNATGAEKKISLQHIIYDAAGKIASTKSITGLVVNDSSAFSNQLIVNKPFLWSVEKPYLYKLKTIIRSSNTVVDEYETVFGIRSFYFDAAKGFFLNNKPLKILGVCNHHDLGALGAAVNVRAIERQLEILKAMGCNGIRTAHNPPAVELLELCDKMGFIVMDEAFDMWKKRKNRFDYHVDFDQWHKKDLEDMVKRDRNHPSVFMWSIGNEIREQFDSTGITIAKELVRIVKNVDATRPVTSALTENFPEKNFIYQSTALDVLGFNYKLADYPALPKRFPGQKFIATETSSALATRGHYDLPSDSNRLWPPDSKSKYATGNADYSVSAYDHVYAYWGSSHEAGWNAVKKNDFMAGIYVWSGFDFLGEPVPYPYPARSSYYGIIDLAGFPKDVYYMYRSEWTTKPVLHLFPHWNWLPGHLVDVWVYYNNADEVELFLNNKSLGIKKKEDDELNVMWRIPFFPGALKAVSRKNGKTVLAKEIKTAGAPAKIELAADRKIIKADGKDLSFVTVKILDKDGNPVPDADDLLTFSVSGAASIAATDNGYPADLTPFKSKSRRCWKGMALVILQSTEKKGNITLKVSAPKLPAAYLTLKTND